jgi:hypothetical protein
MKWVVAFSILGCWLGGGWGLVLGIAIGLLVDDWCRHGDPL